MYVRIQRKEEAGWKEAIDQAALKATQLCWFPCVRAARLLLLVLLVVGLWACSPKPHSQSITVSPLKEGRACGPREERRQTKTFSLPNPAKM